MGLFTEIFSWWGGNTWGTRLFTWRKGKLVGDCDFASCEKVAGSITPVPGGVGPMTIACLLYNTVRAACAIHKVKTPAM